MRPNDEGLEREMFPEYYEMYEKARVDRGYAVAFPEPPLACTGPIEYIPAAVLADIAQVRAANVGCPNS